MAKLGFTKDTLKKQQLVAPGCDWSLCIGAGSSFPIFPSWDKFATDIANNCMHDDKAMLRGLTKIAMDSEVIIQSIYEMRKKEKNFSQKMSETLYSYLLNGLSDEERLLVVNCLTATFPYESLDWKKYINIIEKKRGKKPLTAMCLADYLSDTIYGSKPRAPKNILTFNAELLLPSLINAKCFVKYNKYAKVLNYVTEPTSAQYQDRISICYCHGVLPVPGDCERNSKVFDATDKLVFLENEYLQLANSAFSWQASTFINTLMNSTVFFVGLSFKDPNIRRWMSWIHRSKCEAIKRMNPKASESTSHYWIEKDPKDANVRKWYEASVAHLGIRMIWVDEYNEVVDVLKSTIK